LHPDVPVPIFHQRAWSATQEISMTSLFTSLSRWLKSPVQRRRPTTLRARIGLEQLEGRSLPSAITLTTGGHDHQGQVEVQHQGQLEVHHQGRHRHRGHGGNAAQQQQTSGGPAGSGAGNSRDSGSGQQTEQQQEVQHQVQLPTSTPVSTPVTTYYGVVLGGTVSSTGGGHGHGRDG
jgi:hypothetical protein